MDNDKKRSASQRSYLESLSQRSFDDKFDDLGETESADSDRLRKGQRQMVLLYHPDKQRGRAGKGFARHEDIKVFEDKMTRLNANTL